jgi:hypothetical protein
MTLTEAELRRFLRTAKLRPFYLASTDFQTLKAMAASDPTKYQYTTYNGRPAILRELPNGTHDLFIEDSQ